MRAIHVGLTRLRIGSASHLATIMSDKLQDTKCDDRVNGCGGDEPYGEDHQQCMNPLISTTTNSSSTAGVRSFDRQKSFQDLMRARLAAKQEKIRSEEEYSITQREEKKTR